MKTINIILGLTLAGLVVFPLQNAYARGGGAHIRAIGSHRRDAVHTGADIHSDRKHVLRDTANIRNDRRDIRQDVKSGDTADLKKDKSDLERDFGKRRGDLQDLEKDKSGH